MGLFPRFAHRSEKTLGTSEGATLGGPTISCMGRAHNAIHVIVVATALAACGGSGGSSSAVPSGGTTPTPAPTVAPSSPFDAVIEQSYAGGWGVELAVYRNGALVYAHGYGLRDRGLPDTFASGNIWGIPQPDQQLGLARGQFAPDANTVFDLASVSKEFTAGAILLLQQDGRLSVNDRLSKYFPAIPSADSISLLYLLQHRTGLVDYNNFFDDPDFSGAYDAFMASGQTNYQPIADRLASFPLKFMPGSQYDYSNSNYLLLGMIVANVSGEPLGAFLQQRVFGPLAMTQTQQGYPAPPVSDLALGYASPAGAVVRAPQWNLTWLAGPGGLTSTVGDLEKWDRAVRQPGLIFTQDSLTQMFAPSPFPQSYGTYADGWFVATLDGHRYLWHDGAIGGFQTVNATFPDDGIDIVILTNDGTGLDPYYVVPDVFRIALTSSTTQSRPSARTQVKGIR
jgi:CubicO group peptidase (beta-lactamase class C family)